MFLHFLIFVRGASYDFCVAPAKNAAPVPGMKLYHSLVTFRHGHRSPIFVYLPQANRGYWACDGAGAAAPRIESAPSTKYRYYEQTLDPITAEFPPSCRPGDLTVDGMQQHVNLGAQYRKYLVNELQFLPQKMEPSLFAFYSSPIERCFRSAESFINGLYPPLSTNEVLTITSSSEHLSPLFVTSAMCADYKEMATNFKASEAFKKYFDDLWPILSNAMTQVSLTKTPENIQSFCSWVIAHNCTDATIPPSFVTNDVMEACQKETAYIQYGQYLSAKDIGVAGSAPMRMIMKIIDDALAAQGGKKFSVLSSHDTTVASLLVMLGHNYERIPPYTAHLNVELWQDNAGKSYIRFVYNGSPLVIPSFDDSLMDYQSFRSYIDPKTKYCQEIPV